MSLFPASGSRTSGPVAAARILTLLGDAPVLGWTPAPDASAETSLAPSSGGAWLPDAPADDQMPPVARSEVPAEEALDVSAEAPDTVRALLRSGRLDPGRQGVLALAVVGLVAAAVAGWFLLQGRPKEQPLVAPAVAGAIVSRAGPDLVIDVAGKVRHPGLVHLPVGARVDDALRAAGGVLPGTQTGSLNRARKVADGEQVLVGVDAGPTGSSAGGLLDLNTATASELDALPGIGPVLSDKIVSWRTEHGRFASIDQLREVGGIGEAKYTSIKAKVRV